MPKDKDTLAAIAQRYELNPATDGVYIAWLHKIEVPLPELSQDEQDLAESVIAGLTAKAFSAPGEETSLITEPVPTQLRQALATVSFEDLVGAPPKTPTGPDLPGFGPAGFTHG